MTTAFTTKLFAGALALVAAAGLGATEAAALMAFTYVSDTGIFSGNCQRTAPCGTFFYAQTQTASDGTIICVDPGYYGESGSNGVTITKSLTIDCQAGGASLNVGILTINAPGAFVKLLHVGLDGFRIAIPLVIQNAAAVHLDHVVITGSNGAGIRDTRTGPGQLIITNSLVNLNFGPGIVVVPGGGSTLAVVLDNVTSIGNLYGVAAAAGARIMIKRSVMSGNTTAGVEADPGAVISINDTLISNSSTGVVASGGSSIAISNSDINSNNAAFSGPTVSYGNNRVFANVAVGTPPTPIGAASNQFGQQ